MCVCVGGGILWHKVTNLVTKCKVKEEWGGGGLLQRVR